MSCEITLWIEKPGLQSAQFLLLTWWNWAQDTEDEDNLSNLNSDDWVEGYGAGGSQRFEHWDIIMMAGMVNIMECSYFRSGSTGRAVMAGNDWHLAGRTQPPLERRIFGRWKNWLGFTSPSLFYPARRSYKQYNKFVTVAARFLSADSMYQTTRCRKAFSEMTICLRLHWKDHPWPQLMGCRVFLSNSLLYIYFFFSSLKLLLH